MEKIRSLKELASRHIPEIYKLIEQKKSSWNKLQKKFQKKIDSAVVGTQTESSIPLFLGRAELGEENFIQILKFIDTNILDLASKIPNNLQSEFEKMVVRMIQECDPQTQKKPNPAYLNWLGELLAINKLLESEEYELINFETKLVNGKEADFELKSKSNEVSFVDVVNIHINMEKAETEEGLKKEIDDKLNEKITINFGGTDISDKFILPILWFDYSIIEKVEYYIKNSDLDKRHIIAPCRLTFYEEENIPPYFGAIISNN